MLSPLLIIALCLVFNKQPTIAESLQLAQPALLSASWVPTLAQASVPVQLTQQGGQVVLNGRSVPVVWSQRQQSIGISDAGLMQAFGVNLLNNAEPSTQPIAWFSDPQTGALVLPTWLTGQYRYLDVAELAQKYGWQVQANRSTLQITTPPARLTGIRQGRQSWGDRLVIDLDRPTPWQLKEQRGEAVITLDARIDPALIRGFRPQPGNRLEAVKVETENNRTVIRLAFPTELRPRVWSLDNPHRLLIDIGADAVADREIHWAPGVRWRQQKVDVGNSRFPVISLEVDPRQPGVALKPILGNASVVGTAPLLATAQRSQAAAAINGGFFNRNTQMPLGAIRSGNQWVSGPILNRGAIAWNQAGQAAVGHLSLRETVTASGQQFSVLSLNSGFVGAGVCRYTAEWGTSYSSILEHEVVVSVHNNQVVRQLRVNSAGQTVPIPADGYLLVIRSDSNAVRALSAGTAVQLSSATQPAEFSRYAEIMGAGPLLMQNQQIVLNPQSEEFSSAFIQQSAPRSVIATTATGNLSLIAIHNRIDGQGPTLAETARIVQKMGFVNALNLDGGSSTTLYLGGQLIDRPPSTAARVHNGIGVFLQP